MSPVIIDSEVPLHAAEDTEREDIFESTYYRDDTVDCVLPLYPEDGHRHRVYYVDEKLRRVEPSLMVRATAEINDTYFECLAN